MHPLSANGNAALQHWGDADCGVTDCVTHQQAYLDAFHAFKMCLLAVALMLDQERGLGMGDCKCCLCADLYCCLCLGGHSGASDSQYQFDI